MRLHGDRVDQRLGDATEGWLFGSVPWVERRVLVDVPADAISLHFGFFLKGRGALWAGDFRIERMIAPSLGARPMPPQSQAPEWITPTNLTFSEVIDLSVVTA